MSARPSWLLDRGKGKTFSFTNRQAAMRYADRYKKGWVKIFHRTSGETWTRRKGQWDKTDPGKIRAQA